jgi:hypothetical protein
MSTFIFVVHTVPTVPNRYTVSALMFLSKTYL